MITEVQYKEAIAQREAAQALIYAYQAQETKGFEQRWLAFKAGKLVFTDMELRYSAEARCEKCGAGLAYPVACGPHHHWSCSEELKGKTKGHPELPFVFYNITSEHSGRCPRSSTRPTS